jgi:hypothetical protein
MKPWQIYDVEYECRGIEDAGTLRGYWDGTRVEGKRVIDSLYGPPTLYLFDDEIQSLSIPEPAEEE